MADLDIISKQPAAIRATAVHKHLLVSVLVVALLAATGAYLSGSLGFAKPRPKHKLRSRRRRQSNAAGEEIIGEP
jgi:hypothetical protein